MSRPPATRAGQELRQPPIRAVLTDIEGTTSSLSFVADVLFPYARRALPDYVRAHRDDAEVAAALCDARACERDCPTDDDATVRLLLTWMDEDRKVTPLKALQGYVWREGYRSGAFAGHVYDDAARCLRRWHAAGVRLFIFSSGSVEAQRLLFQHSTHGDLTGLFSGFFDTTTGGKRDSSSYTMIARAIGAQPPEIIFLSDTPEELDAAREAGMVTTWLHRGGEAGTQASHPHPEAATFDTVDALLFPPFTGHGRGAMEHAGSDSAKGPSSR
ncbi:MAG: acireductone synthase [Myxococcota bacterium]|nr:acireductone synthase [Myxococcota bacterium]